MVRSALNHLFARTRQRAERAVLLELWSRTQLPAIHAIGSAEARRRSLRGPGTRFDSPPSRLIGEPFLYLGTVTVTTDDVVLPDSSVQATVMV